MKVRKILLLVLVFTLTGAATVFADTFTDRFAGKKVKVTVNGQDIGASGMRLEVEKDQVKSMVPLREMANTIGGFTRWDEATNTISIEKPNVNLIVLENGTPFGVVTTGKQLEVTLVAQIDSLKTDISSLKLSINDPFGSEVANIVQPVNETREYFWYKSEKITVDFKYTGKYTYNFYMKGASGDYVLMSQLAIYSKKQ